MASNINNLKISLKWRRPQSVEYPKVWHRFFARDLNSDNLVEYRIEDITESNANNVIEYMKTHYIHDEPLACAMGCTDDELYYGDHKTIWDAVFDQKTPIVCYKTGSDEIVGVYMTFVESKSDNFGQQFIDACRSDDRIKKSELTKNLSSNFCPFQYYGVDTVLTEFGLSVNRKYRGRGIGVQLLSTSKLLCKEYGLKVAYGSFTSVYSGVCASKAGFVTNIAASYADYLKEHPEHTWMHNIEANHQYTKQSLII